MEGLITGLPLSGILSEILLNNQENQHLCDNIKTNLTRISVKLCFNSDKYMIFLYFLNGNTRQLNILNNYLNKMNKNMQFTLEI